LPPILSKAILNPPIPANKSAKTKLIVVFKPLSLFTIVSVDLSMRSLNPPSTNQNAIA
jgi:hypothetical protein